MIGHQLVRRVRPDRTAVARLRSAASPLRVSMNRRYQAPSRPAGSGAPERFEGEAGAWPRVSRETKAKPVHQGQDPILGVAGCRGRWPWR